jgi:hypothetical protein
MAFRSRAWWASASILREYCSSSDCWSDWDAAASKAGANAGAGGDVPMVDVKMYGAPDKAAAADEMW